MAYLGRQIAPGRWRDARRNSPEIPPERVPAVVFLNRNYFNLQSSTNRLSFWESTTSPNDALETTALAMAAKSTIIDDLTVTWIEREALERAGVEFEHTNGETPVPDLQRRHVEAIRLDVGNAAAIAAAVGAALDEAATEPSRVRNLTQGEVRTLLQKAIADGRLLPASLKKGVKEALGIRD